MLSVEVGKREALASLFFGMEATMILSCLQGKMGRAYADALPPSCAQILLGDFAFLAGDASAPGAEALIRHLPRRLFTIPKEAEWGPRLAAIHGERCRETVRYAFRRTPDFKRGQLERLTATLPEGVNLEPIGRGWFGWTRNSWARDFCSQFPTFESYARDGIGFVAVRGDEVLAGASSYSVYEGGIEIQVDTREDCRRRGLAAACAARLILTCLDRGLYPNWDAANEASAALAEKLGYRMDHAYIAYLLEPEPPASPQSVEQGEVYT